LNKQKYRI